METEGLITAFNKVFGKEVVHRTCISNRDARHATGFCSGSLGATSRRRPFQSVSGGNVGGFPEELFARASPLRVDSVTPRMHWRTPHTVLSHSTAVSRLTARRIRGESWRMGSSWMAPSRTFRDGHTQAVRNYSLTPRMSSSSMTLPRTQEPCTSLSELNLSATEQAAR